MSPVIAQRTGNYMLTFSGRRFWPTDPHPDDVHLEDIAHALALQNRFGGHTRSPYSVAQHCVLVSELVPPALALEGLFHDASEAYIVDIPRPLKYSVGMEGYKPIEAAVQEAICLKYGLPATLAPAIKVADDAACYAEMRDLMPPAQVELVGYLASYSASVRRRRGIQLQDMVDAVPEVRPWPWQYAKEQWVRRYIALGGTERL